MIIYSTINKIIREAHLSGRLFRLSHILHIDLPSEQNSGTEVSNRSIINPVSLNISIAR